MATYKPVTQADADIMFLFWQESGRNVSRTAKKFKKGRTSITRYCKKFGWIAKADTIETKKTNVIAEKQIDDMTLITALQRRVAKALLESKHLEKVTVADFAALTRLKLEIQGDIPIPDAGSNSVTVNVNTGGGDINEQNEDDADLAAIFRHGIKNPRLVSSDN